MLLDRRLLTRNFAPFPAVHLLMGVVFGAVPVCLTAFAAASGLVSLVTGLAYGAQADRVSPLCVMIAAPVILAGGAWS